MKTKTVTNYLKQIVILSLTLISFSTVAQEEEEKKWFENLSISGSVDGYFRTNLSTSNKANGNGSFNAPGTSFVDRSGFSVGMINVIAAYEGEKTGFVADLAYGPRGANAIDGEGSENIVNQAYAYWNATEGMTLTIGRFNTFLGYEVISPVGNFNYSTSYMFSNGPFSHNGIKADFTLSDNWSAMLAVMNGTDVTFGNPRGNYVLGAQLGYSNDNGSAYLNFRYGDEAQEEEVAAIPLEFNATVFQADLTTGWDVSEDFYVGFNGTILTRQEADNGFPAGGFIGAALYPQYSFSDAFALGLRGEYFSRNIDVDGVDDSSVIATTLTAQYKVGNLTIIPEFRLDSTDEDNPVDDAFTDNDGMPTGSLSSFVIGAVYSF